MSGHVAIVLAAGGSRRLGRPKQLIRRNGETLVSRALRLARATSPRRLLLVVGARAAEIVGLVQADDVQVVVNPRWRDGLSSSVLAARAALAEEQDPATGCMLLACDQPALEIDHLTALLHAAAQAPAGCAGIVHGARIGIPAVVSLAQLRQADPHGDAGLRELLNAMPPACAGMVVAPQLCMDLDTPPDLDLAAQQGLIDRASV
ncbi:NTP transferase domain-containing protein [Pseudoxanthomonas sp. JBR18]|uniref:nucleotidyltransferase family protein n=1 Tax=Pseudoxanthomonas sp. JBR18 TaxID=2969308 RepID=UPI0023062C8A|nr:NTP transferase domain-containing protein [Pseudoxanthomonas sp. JBR18]WCE04937.1 NTP transferase domain-containing protein [Pseudoxanthomonas sp. JBR18]